MRKVLAAGLATGLAMVASNGWAITGKCVLEVDGKSYLNGSCEITNQDGWLSIGMGEKDSSPYFASIDTADGTGKWNGAEGESHAQEDLGILKKNGDAPNGDR